MPEANEATSSRAGARLVSLAAAAWTFAVPARAATGPWPAGEPPPVAPAAEAPALVQPAPAPPPPAPEGVPEFTGITAESVLLATAGVATAFVVHEACHAVANLSMANVPTLEPVRFVGVVPFFAVSPNIHCTDGACTRRDGQPFVPGPRGYAFIVGSGILCQQITNEIILTENPRIRSETAPFLKGMLLFNTALSFAYGIANIAGIEPPEGDLHGLDAATGYPRGVMAAAVMAAAGLDVARYFLPDSTWLPWVGRGAKVVTLGLIVAF
ncbi:MAG TPA: hypothetical protein VFM53_03295 [Anaeromyxobacteraceae bacterium]|nr:hypothetical protein [Anaeromyxobacteraceae bacterium]